MAEIVHSEIGIRPPISIEEAKRVFSHHYNLPQAIELKELNSYSDRNYYIKVESGGEYLLKIMCEQDSNLPYMNAIAKLLVLIDSKNFSFQCSKPILSKNGNFVEMVSFSTDVRHCVVLLSYIPGFLLKDILKGTNIELKVLFDLGKSLGQLETVIMEYYDPGVEFRKEYIWDTAKLKMIEKYFPKVKDFVEPKDLELLERYFKKFLQHIEPNLHKFHQNLIHSDLNEMNILVDTTGKLTGIIDFTDSVYSHRIFEIGTCVAYIMMHCFSEGIEPFQVGRYLIQGFVTEIDLSEVERTHLLTAVTSRLVLTAVMGYYYYSLEPTNEYILNSPRPAVKLLRHISEYETSVVEEMLFKPL